MGRATSATPPPLTAKSSSWSVVGPVPDVESPQDSLPACFSPRRGNPEPPPPPPDQPVPPHLDDDDDEDEEEGSEGKRQETLREVEEETGGMGSDGTLPAWRRGTPTRENKTRQTREGLESGPRSSQFGGRHGYHLPPSNFDGPAAPSPHPWGEEVRISEQHDDPFQFCSPPPPPYIAETFLGEVDRPAVLGHVSLSVADAPPDANPRFQFQARRKRREHSGRSRPGLAPERARPADRALARLTPRSSCPLPAQTHLHEHGPG